MSITKIAAITGASVSTVARVLRDPEHKCHSMELKEKILQTAREIGYVPNEAAKALKSGSAPNKIFHINILLTRVNSDETDPFYSEMLRLVEIEVRKSGGLIENIFSSEKKTDFSEIEKSAAQMFHDTKQKHDGLILIGKCSQKGLKSLKRYEKNLISINRNSTTYEVDEVLCDGRKIALTAVNYLISCGHQKIGYVGDCHNETRYVGYQEALVHHGIAPDIDDVYDITPNEKNGYQAMAYFSQQETPPSAFYCANDILAIGMLKYLAQSKNWYYHPAVISSDNIVESQYTTPMLTTVSLPKTEMAHLAIQILTDRMNGGHKAVVKTELQSTLVIRQSVHQYVSTERQYRTKSANDSVRGFLDYSAFPFVRYCVGVMPVSFLNCCMK